ncbi:MAG TPA: hypothetical protein PKD85_12210 [Saprospiraceae bacterium]|nr:hypothetical protein [Saprospiraceae bacterium]
MKKLPLFSFAFLLIALLANCEKEINESPDTTKPKPEPKVINVAIVKDSTFQVIAGFGGANRIWGTEFLKPAAAKLAFGLGEEELGLSIFRIRIPSTPGEWPLIVESALEAQKIGIKILACPWSPPAALKNNKNIVGGHLLPENYGAFKDYINEFIKFMKNNGVDIYAVSIQNEPDIKVSYESCDWTETEMIKFIAEFGHLIEGSKLAAPESFNFNRNFTNSLLLNPEAVKNIDIVAGHIYGNGLGTLPIAEEAKKEIWMTEYLLNLNTGNTGAAPWTLYSETAKFEETLEMLRTIHLSMKSNWNAYIWWYLQRYYSFIGDGDQGTVQGAILKRGWAFSHFSKYIRPGYTRIGVKSPADTNLQITAYQGDGKTVVVVINPSEITIDKLELDLPKVSSAKVYETSVEENRKEKTVTISGNKVTVQSTKKSVITVVVNE